MAHLTNGNVNWVQPFQKVFVLCFTLLSAPEILIYLDLVIPLTGIYAENTEVQTKVCV